MESSSSFSPKSFQVRNQGTIDNETHPELPHPHLVLLEFFITGHSLDFNVPIIIICHNSISIERVNNGSKLGRVEWVMATSAHGGILGGWEQPKTAEMTQIYCWDSQDFEAGGFFFFGTRASLKFYSGFILAASFFSPFFYLTHIDFFFFFLVCRLETMQDFCCCGFYFFFFPLNLISFPICVCDCGEISHDGTWLGPAHFKIHSVTLEFTSPWLLSVWNVVFLHLQIKF